MFDFARGKCRAAYQGSVILAANVVAVPLTRPPGHHARRRWDAGGDGRLRRAHVRRLGARAEMRKVNCAAEDQREESRKSEAKRKTHAGPPFAEKRIEISQRLVVVRRE